MKPHHWIIDCDVHPNANEKAPISPFIPEKFHQAVAQGQASTPSMGYQNPFGVKRRDASFECLEDLEEGLLNRYPIAYALIQSPGIGASIISCNSVASAMAQAWNEWQIANYLDRDKRMLGSVSVNLNDIPHAVEQIHRFGSHPQFVQVLVPGEAIDLYGKKTFWPVYKACCEENLVFALHPGKEGCMSPSTPVGRPGSYFEWHCGLPITFMAHLISLVSEGVFEEFPELKLMLTEGGYGWVPHVMWRMDKNYKALRSTTPWLKERPSEYIRQHVRFTTQPVEESDRPDQALALFDIIHAEETLCFSSDYPHWDFDDPFEVFPRKIDPSLLHRILAGNAADLFNLKLPVDAPVLA